MKILGQLIIRIMLAFGTIYLNGFNTPLAKRRRLLIFMVIAYLIIHFYNTNVIYRIGIKYYRLKPIAKALDALNTDYLIEYGRLTNRERITGLCKERGFVFVKEIEGVFICRDGVWFCYDIK